MPHSMQRLLTAVLLSTASAAIGQPLIPSEIEADAARRAAAVATQTPPAPWGCTVLLCLANPNGPTAVAQCVAPIRQLWRDLRRGRPFPACPMARGPQGGAFARLGYDPYDPCPPGTTELKPGRHVQATIVRTHAPSTTDPSALQDSTSASAPITVSPTGTDALPTAPSSQPPRVCGGRLIGDRTVITQDAFQIVSVYDELTLLPASSAPRFVEILIDRGDGRGAVSSTRIRF